METRLFGIILIASGSACFALAGLFIQFVNKDTTSWVALFAGLAVGGIVVLPVAILRRGWVGALASEHRGTLIARGLVSFAQVGALFYALHSIPLTDALLFRQTAPLWLPILSAVFLKEPMPRRFWGPLCLGFLGVALVLHPKLSGFSIGYVVAILCGFLFAIQTLLNRRLKQQNEPQERILAYIYGIGIATSFGPAALTFAPFGVQTLLWLFLGGVLMLASTGCLTLAYGMAPAWLLSPVGYVAIVFAALLDWLVLDQTPSPLAATGMGLVILSGILIVVMSNRRQSPDPDLGHA